MKNIIQTGLATLFLLLLSQNAFAQQVKLEPDARFLKWDVNKDNKLSRDELPERLRKNFDRVDSNNDESISLKEHLAVGRAAQSKAKNQKGNAKNGNRKPQLPQGTKILKDIVYVEDGHQRHKLDLYLPANATAENPVPIVIWIHGGGWRNGSKNNFGGLVPLAQKGFAVASINYRLSGHAIFPAQIHDCKSAIRYLRKHAAKHGYDPHKFGVWGSSAGGHLVALLGTSGDVKELEGNLGVTGVSSRVQLVCDWYGPTELLKMNEQAGEKSKIDHDAKNSPESLLIGGPIQENKEKTRKADPISYVTADDPRFLIMHGDQDLLVPHSQSRTLHDLLEKANVQSEFILVEGAGHGFRDAKSRQRPIEFFAKHFLGQ